MAHLAYEGKFAGPEVITAGIPQTLTAAWVDLNGGAELYVAGAARVKLYLDLDINNSTGVLVRMLELHTEGGTEYPVQTVAVGAVAVDIQAGYYEFTLNADQNAPLEWETNGNVARVVFQVMATVLGAPAGIITAATVTTGAF